MRVRATGSLRAHHYFVVGHSRRCPRVPKSKVGFLVNSVSETRLKLRQGVTFTFTSCREGKSKKRARGRDENSYGLTLDLE